MGIMVRPFEMPGGYGFQAGAPSPPCDWMRPVWPSRLAAGGVMASACIKGKTAFTAYAAFARRGLPPDETGAPKSAPKDSWNCSGCFIRPTIAGPSRNCGFGLSVVAFLLKGSAGKAARCRFYIGRYRRRGILPRFLRADLGVQEVA